MRSQVRYEELTPRELTCLTMLACGSSVEEVADELRISALSINVYLDMASKKLQTRGLAQTIALALALDLISREAVLNGMQFPPSQCGKDRGL